MHELVQGLLRALCFDTAWGYAPTRVELMAHWDGGRDKKGGHTQSGTEYGGGLDAVFQQLLSQNTITELRGRLVFPGNESLIQEHEKREAFFPRKLCKARRVVQWLRRIEGVRFVALCNTTALAHARDAGDLDFFIVTKPGVIWQTRAWASLPFKLFGDRPTEHAEKQDAVCLSFFVDETELDLSSLLLPQDDPYFRHWFLSLLPLYDQGVMECLWAANTSIRQPHPYAPRWILHPTLQAAQPALRIPCLSRLETKARALQEKAFPASIRQGMHQGTRVVADEHILKFHVEDGRERFRERYYEQCARYGVSP